MAAQRSSTTVAHLNRCGSFIFFWMLKALVYIKSGGLRSKIGKVYNRTYRWGLKCLMQISLSCLKILHKETSILDKTPKMYCKTRKDLTSAWRQSRSRILFLKANKNRVVCLPTPVSSSKRDHATYLRFIPLNENSSDGARDQGGFAGWRGSLNSQVNYSV